LNAISGHGGRRHDLVLPLSALLVLQAFGVATILWPPP
jgi:hypothetical protein